MPPPDLSPIIRRDLEYCATVFEETGQPVPSLSFTDFATDSDLLACYSPLIPAMDLAQLRSVNTSRAAVLRRHGIAAVPVRIAARDFLQWKLIRDRQPSALTVEDYLRSLPPPPAKPLPVLIPGYMVGNAAENLHDPKDPGWVVSRAPLVIARCACEGDYAVRFEIWDVERFAALSAKRQAKISHALLHSWREEFDADIADFAADRPRGWSQPPSLLLESTPSRFTGWLRCSSPMAIFPALEHRAGFTNVLWLDDPLDLASAVIAEELDNYAAYLDAEAP